MTVMVVSKEVVTVCHKYLGRAVNHFFCAYSQIFYKGYIFVPMFDNLYFFPPNVLKSYLGWYVVPSLHSSSPTEDQLGEAHPPPGVLLRYWLWFDGAEILK